MLCNVEEVKLVLVRTAVALALIGGSSSKVLLASTFAPMY